MHYPPYSISTCGKLNLTSREFKCGGKILRECDVVFLVLFNDLQAERTQQIHSNTLKIRTVDIQI